jgi:deazaflavin-dependent oxidoreductase (nitroreductase family)
MDSLFGQDHVDRYKATDGEEGYEWRGTQTLLLTTTGRRSGEPRTTPLIFAPVGEDYAIVASKGGSDAPPAWYLNLSEEPTVEVQIKGDVFKARARTASSEERAEIWPTMTSEWPAYDEYQASTEREIPIVLLERA